MPGEEQAPGEVKENYEAGKYNKHNATGAIHEVTVTGQRISRIRNISSDRVLGRIGGGLEYQSAENIDAT